MYEESPRNRTPTGRIHPSPVLTLPSPLGVAKQNGTQQSTPVGPQSKQEAYDSDNKKMFQEIQGSLMVVAVLAAGATYQAGLSPPGGFGKTGKPLLEDTFPRRYTAFFYCNSTAFIMSLVIIIILMNSRFYNHPGMIKVLKISMVLDLFGFMGAYAAGSCREVTSSIYLFIVMGGVFIYIILFAWFYGMIRNCVSRVTGLQQYA